MKPAKPVLAVFMLAFVALSGCAEPEPDPPPVLIVEKLRHWFEDDDKIIVSLTIYNQANITPGVGTFEPSVQVSLMHRDAVSTNGKPGEETKYPGKGWIDPDIRLYFSMKDREPWQNRWVVDGRNPTTGPMEINPGERVHMEFEFMEKRHYEGDEGYYHIWIDMDTFYPANSPQEGQTVAWYEFHSGCFNHDIEEFYGVKNPGVDCHIWDCTGEWTETGYAAYGREPIKDEYKPDCSATDATGPQYV